MTNNAIKTERILRAVYKAKRSDWNTRMQEYGKLTFEEFQRILRREDIATDVRTIRNKWEILKDKEIFVLAHNDVTLVDLYVLSDLLPECTFTFHETAHTQNTHTNTIEVRQ